MIKSLLVTAAVIGILLIIRKVKREPLKKRPKLILKYSLLLIAVIVIALVVLGKLHWIAAGIAAILPLIQRIFSTSIRFMPFIQQWFAQKKQSEQHHQQSKHTPPTSDEMTVKRAQEIFGLDNITSVEQVSKRHKELMQKNHPDRGGSDYLAAQINHAKDVLVDHIKSKSA